MEYIPMKNKRVYSYYRSYVLHLQLAELINENISSEDIDLNELRFSPYRKFFIGENLIQFIYFDIDQAINDELNVFNEEMAQLKRYTDVDPDFFWSYAYQLFNEKHEIDENRLQEFKRIQSECKEALLELCDDREKGIIYTPSTSEEKEIRNMILAGKKRVWYEFPDLASAVEFELMALKLSPSCVFICKECGRIGVGTERATCCSKTVKEIPSEKVWEETFSDGSPSIFHPYFELRVYTCKDAYRDRKHAEVKKAGTEMEQIFYKSIDRIKQMKRRKNLEYHPEYKSLKTNLLELAEELQEDYDDIINEDERMELIEEYKKAFDILVMPPDENGKYMTWDEWVSIYNN